jgi:hypothetical protein
MKPQIGKEFIALQSPLIFFLWSTDILRLIQENEAQRVHACYIRSCVAEEKQQLIL